MNGFRAREEDARVRGEMIGRLVDVIVSEISAVHGEANVRHHGVEELYPDGRETWTALWRDDAGTLWGLAVSRVPGPEGPITVSASGIGTGVVSAQAVVTTPVAADSMLRMFLGLTKEGA